MESAVDRLPGRARPGCGRLPVSQGAGGSGRFPRAFRSTSSADQRFVLFVNGQRVGIGPSRGDLYYWRFETFDLAPFLKPGRNLLSALVWNFGKDAPVAQVTDRTGFIVEADSEAEAGARTDATWQCAPEPGHQPWPEGVTGAARQIGTYFVVGPGRAPRRGFLRLGLGAHSVR